LYEDFFTNAGIARGSRFMNDVTSRRPDRTAEISRCGKYRYVLTRRVGEGDRTAAFIMLNPSTADAIRDDPTIRKCIGFARKWGCGRLIVLNLFAFRTKSPSLLKRVRAPVGPRNEDWFKRTLANRNQPCLVGPVVCAWGDYGSHRDQDRTVLGWLDDLGIEPLALRLTKHGHPYHPLYAPYSARLTRYRVKAQRMRK
jgi:hypothetical protein